MRQRGRGCGNTGGSVSPPGSGCYGPGQRVACWLGPALRCAALGDVEEKLTVLAHRYRGGAEGRVGDEWTGIEPITLPLNLGRFKGRRVTSPFGIYRLG